MSKPRVYDDRHQMQIRLTNDMWDRLRMEAERRAVSKNLLVERMVMTMLPKLEQQKL
jgi:hypothetical protein